MSELGEYELLLVLSLFARTTRVSKSGSHRGHNGQAAVNVVRKRRIKACSCGFLAALIVVC